MGKRDKRKRKISREGGTQAPHAKQSETVTPAVAQAPYAENDSDDDDELMLAAAQWAQDSGSGTNHIREAKDDDRLSQKPPPSAATPAALQKGNPFSLHVTNIPFDATNIDVRKHFAAECSIDSIRLVYDRGDAMQRQFRGVAFVDLNDETSYDRALRLHHSKLLGRAINVRPTRTRQELSKIVQVTRDKVRDKIHKLLRKKKNTNDRKETPKKKKGSNSSNKHKMSKQERNRKAAILRHGGGGKRK